MRKAYFAGGCFWCMTPIFKIQKGVISVISGYCGGDEENPSYEDVKKQKTGHRETVCITYDESLISYERLLEIYLCNVDPYDPGGQFIDRGRSYTLAVYPTNPEEQEILQNVFRKMEAESGHSPCIALEPFKSFYPAEEEHQDYYLKHPDAFAEELKTSGRDTFRNS